jgi:hypothetical protein
MEFIFFFNPFLRVEKHLNDFLHDFVNLAHMLKFSFN